MPSCAILSQNDRGLGQILLVIYNPQTYGFSFSSPFFPGTPHFRSKNTYYHNETVIWKTRYKDPHISEGGRARIHPRREEGPETGVRLSSVESTNVLIRSTEYDFREQQQCNFHNWFSILQDPL